MHQVAHDEWAVGEHQRLVAVLPDDRASAAEQRHPHQPAKDLNLAVRICLDRLVPAAASGLGDAQLRGPAARLGDLRLPLLASVAVHLGVVGAPAARPVQLGPAEMAPSHAGPDGQGRPGQTDLKVDAPAVRAVSQRPCVQLPSSTTATVRPALGCASTMIASVVSTPEWTMRLVSVNVPGVAATNFRRSVVVL